ncbi:hypothetical protein V1478_014443 [Vespula squamosa]|uniref:Uncharacterized protein n=1 Tax=Vespula squamosa TaxID=30214 RepID=A0ABD2A8Y0_VESSQ
MAYNIELIQYCLSYTIDYFAALYCIILKKSTKDDNEEDKDEYLYNDSIFDNYEYELTAFIILKNSYEV